MNSSEYGEVSEEAMLDNEHNHVQDVKEESEDVSICESPEALAGGGSPGAPEAGSRPSSGRGPYTYQTTGSSKRARLSSEMRRHLMDESGRHEPLCLATTGERRSHVQQKPRVSSRKPLFSISHRISERRITPSLEQQAAHGAAAAAILSSKLQSSEGNGPPVTPPATDALGQAPSADAGLYPLIEKMFLILNTLNSSMTQLQSKVDLLTLEVLRIKKQIEPAEMGAEFQPPPEYLLTSDELNRLMEQTSGAGELGCRLLVHLFPELFEAGECAHECAASKRTLESLHLQLIRNYVEACYPSVKGSGVWQDECLLQVNDLFNRFWAQRDTEGARLLRKQAAAAAGAAIKAERPETCRFIDEEGREEHAPSEEQQGGGAATDLAFDARATEELDEFSSPEDFVVFLMHRLFPEVFEEGRMPEGSGPCGSVGQLILDSDKMEIIRKYMEANFPDVPEDSWLQVCVQHMEDALEGPHSNGSDGDGGNHEGYDPAGRPGDESGIEVPEAGDYERPGRKAKKSLLTPVDFDHLEVPLPAFPVPQEYLLPREQLKNNYECSLSIGNFASRLLVLMFPELFTRDNARKQYNCSGSLGKKQLDPVRVNLIRHYVQLVYSRANDDRVWTLEFVGKLDERCRRRDTEQRRSYLQQRKVYGHEADRDFLCRLNQLHPESTREEEDAPPLPPEKSSKDFCKIPLEELTVSTPDFPVPSLYLLSDAEVREVVQQSLSVGNFAARLLVRLFPELFTQENLRLQYNHSGACNKRQLDPTRLRLIRHYVEAVYPVDKMEEVWHYECVPSVDERCRRPNRKKCDILKKAKRSSTVS